MDAALSSHTVSIIYKPYRNHQDAIALSHIQWPEVIERNSQTVKTVCEGVQTSPGKVEVLNNGVQALTLLFQDRVQPEMTAHDWRPNLNLKIVSLVQY